MTDTADYLLSRIAELSVSVEWGDTYWKAALVILVIGLALIMLGMLWHHLFSGLYYSDGESLAVWIGAATALFGVIGTLAIYANMLHEQDALLGLVASYEALYGPLPEGIL